MKTLSEIKLAISALSPSEQLQLISDLQIGNYGAKSYLSDLYTKKEADLSICCPHCKSIAVLSRGYHKNIRRLQCKECDRYFTSTSGTAIHGIHKKDKWQAYVQCMEEGLSLRVAAERVGICLQTSFRWRHRILKSLSVVQSEEFGGIVESDEMYIGYSQKGEKQLNRKPKKRGTDGKKSDGENKVGILVTTDRSGHRQAKTVGTSTMNRQALYETLHGKIDPDAILCTDSYKVYQGFAKRENIKHKEVVIYGKPTLKEKAYHIQTVNGLHKQIKQHLARFNGVSTKYLQNYLNWFIAQKGSLSTTDKVKKWLWICIAIPNAPYYEIKTLI